MNNELTSTIELKWHIVGKHFLLLYEICQAFTTDCCFQIFQSLLHFMTHRNFVFSGNKEIQGRRMKPCIKWAFIDCCVHTHTEFIEQVWHIIGWSVPEQALHIPKMEPICNSQAQKLLAVPYEETIYVYC